MSDFSGNECFEFVINVRGGKNLENKKFLGNNAPFVELTMGKDTKRTLCASSLKDANWNETIGFKFNKWEEIPNCISLKVKDENMLLPNPVIGEYCIKLDKSMLKKEPLFTLHDGLLNLENGQAQLDVEVLFKYYNGSQFEEKAKDQKSAELYSSEKRSEFTKTEKDETHVLSTLELQDKPVILEKEVEYHKPVEVKEKIIHKEKPIIVEQPIIKEKFESYSEQPQIEQKVETIIKESKHSKDVGNLDKESLENLRELRQREFMDTQPVVEHAKEHVQLEKEVRQVPTKITEKEVVYQQPVEINKTYVEKIIPTVHEDVKVIQEHVYQKLPPDIQQQEAEFIQEDSTQYSQEKTLESERSTKSRSEVRSEVRNQ